MNRIALFATALLTASLAVPVAAQSGDRRFDVGRFDAIELTGSDDVRVVAGDTVSVVASGDPRAVAALAIEVRGDTLRVGRRPGNWRDKGALVTVTMPTLRAATISGSGGIRAAGIEGRAFTGRIGGSGGMTLAALRVGSVRFDLAGSGSIVADGSADSVAIDLGGSGNVDTRRLATPAVTVDIGGSGSVAATASRTAAVRAGGSGSVRITGGARCDVRKGGSGSVRCG